MRVYIGVAILLGACTGDITGDPAPLPMAPPPAPVQVTVRDGNAPQAGLDVLFQNSDGSVVAETKTDATGAASAPMATGNVTVIRTFPAGSGAQRDPEIYTYVGAAAGDQLQLGDPNDDTGTPKTINVTVPASATGNVAITATCGAGQGTAPTVQMTMAGCPSQVEFFVTDGDGDSFVEKLPSGPMVDLSNGDFEGTLSTSFAANNVGSDVASVAVQAYAMDGTHELWSSDSQTITPGTPTNVDLPNLHGIDELVVTTIDAMNGSQLIASRQAYVASPYTFDASTHVLPYVSATSYKSTGATWTETGAGTADFVVATFAVSGTQKYTRYVIAPHTGKTLALPTLAGNGTAYNPAASDAITGTLGIGTMTGGYTSARQIAFSTPDLADGAPMNGSLALSYDGSAPTL